MRKWGVIHPLINNFHYIWVSRNDQRMNNLSLSFFIRILTLENPNLRKKYCYSNQYINLVWKPSYMKYHHRWHFNIILLEGCSTWVLTKKSLWDHLETWCYMTRYTKNILYYMLNKTNYIFVKAKFCEVYIFFSIIGKAQTPEREGARKK